MQAVVQQDYRDRVFFAQRFGLWLTIAAMSMMFAGFTSAYIVKKADAANWTSFSLPTVFYISTALILLSSVTMFFAKRAFNKEQIGRYRRLLMVTLVLGAGFIISQLIGWNALNNMGFHLTNEISGSFFYVISGVHGVHVLGGIAILLISWLQVKKKLKNPAYDLTLAFSPKRKIRVELVATYWHFVDALWIYLFIFLLFNHS